MATSGFICVPLQPAGVTLKFTPAASPFIVMRWPYKTASLFLASSHPKTAAQQCPMADVGFLCMVVPMSSSSHLSSADRPVRGVIIYKNEH